MSWTPERVERARELWDQGLSAAKIAGIFGDVTRNAVVGLAHRKGFAPRAVGVPKGTRKRRDPISLKSVETAPKTENQPEQISFDPPETDDPRAFKGCRFPIGDWPDDDFRFCQAKQRDGSSYCEHHHKECCVGAPPPNVKGVRI